MDKMMNEKNLRELEYEREMQEQADDIERWKLRKEIKKKLRALRKKVRKDEASLPQLQTISRRLDDVEKPLQECVQENPERKLNSYNDLNIHITPAHAQTYKARYIFAKYPTPSLEEFGESFGRQLMQEGLIKVKIYDDNNDSENIGVVEMQIDVVVEDR